MRLYMYGEDIFSADSAIETANGYFQGERTTLENKMKQVERWQKRLNQLKDPQMLTKVKTLITKFQDLTTQYNITWVPSENKWASSLSAKYLKDDVSLDLYLDLNVTPDKLWANFYSKKNNQMALRIYIGKEVRITNRILQCLLKG